MSEIIILERIKNYLGSGGLFNPELMEHEKVRDLIMDCRDEIQKRDTEIDKLKNENKELKKSNTDSVIALRFSLMTNQIKKLKVDLKREQDRVDEFILMNEHADFCRFKYGEECSDQCMGSHYSLENQLKLARLTQQQRREG